MSNGLEILAQTVVSGNLILIQGLGLYALTRYTKNVKEAVEAGISVVTSMLVGSVLLWLCGSIIPSSPVPQLGFYLLAALAAAVLAPRILKQDPSAEKMAVDSALVGLLLLLGRDGVTGVQNVWIALGAGVGYLLVLVVIATIRKRLELAPIPKPLQGLPILLITAGLLAAALMGFRF
jgi:Na+-translocating ferredoxin:NAD+ oxidoreductase RnfA subunit